jgi:DNA-binding NtrC family response regulator
VVQPDQAAGVVLVVDDDEDVLVSARLLLKHSFAEVASTTRPDELPRLVADRQPDVILLDMNFSRGATSGEEGFRWLAQVLGADPAAVVVVMTAHGGVEIAVEAIKRGATDFVQKPWSNERLVATVRTAVQLRRSRREAAVLAAQNRVLAADSAGAEQPLVGQSAAMQQIHSLLARAAPTEASVLILGENGTGKGLVARELHRLSRRAGHPFVAVDLGSIAASLFESELFGHKKGAFTDAKADRVGRLQAAAGGTLFLDELGNVPLELQAKLLSALEQRAVVPVGASAPVPIDARIISATNLPLSRLHDPSVLRQDLLYRLNTVELVLPPLRERRSDILPLVEYFLGIYARKYGRAPKPLAEGAAAALVAYDWPGNVRSLRHAVERAVILSEGPRFEADDFYLSAPRLSSPSPTPAAPPPALAPPTLNLDAVERGVIESALKKHAWNISHAAQELGLTRASLYRRMEKHGL